MVTKRLVTRIRVIRNRFVEPIGIGVGLIDIGQGGPTLERHRRLVGQRIMAEQQIMAGQQIMVRHIMVRHIMGWSIIAEAQLLRPPRVIKHIGPIGVEHIGARHMRLSRVQLIGLIRPIRAIGGRLISQQGSTRLFLGICRLVRTLSKFVFIKFLPVYFS